MKNRSRLLFVAAAIALAAWLIFIGLFLQLSSYDPYSWAFPGMESELSRSLYLDRRDLYVKLGVGSFVFGVVSGLAALLTKRINPD
ncbi:MAG: hypothetical protein QOD32_2832 [Pyrinomonadaceae bacterium]|jgi:hypothetical protein|nr:hypothetical protein [Pyrinomonadaceae bacterium]